jgi:hypothetical protein
VIAARGLGWITVECRLASFVDEDTAREAAFCVRDEGRSLAEVASAVGSREEAETLVLEDLEPVLRGSLLSAKEGTLLGPVSFRGTPTLVVVHRKSRPEAPGPQILSRARAALLETAIERETRGRARLRTVL